MSALPIYKGKFLDQFLITGRTIVITGAGGRGLGLSFADGLAQAGANIAIIDHVDEPASYFSSLAAYGGQYRYYKSDVTNYEGLKETMDLIAKDYGTIHGWYVSDQPSNLYNSADWILQYRGCRLHLRQTVSGAHSSRRGQDSRHQCRLSRIARIVLLRRGALTGMLFPGERGVLHDSACRKEDEGGRGRGQPRRDRLNGKLQVPRGTLDLGVHGFQVCRSRVHGPDRKGIGAV